MSNPTTLGQDYLHWKQKNGLIRADRQELLDFLHTELWRVRQYFVNQATGDAQAIRQEREEMAWDIQGLIALDLELEMFNDT